MQYNAKYVKSEIANLAKDATSHADLGKRSNWEVHQNTHTTDK